MQLFCRLRARLPGPAQSAMLWRQLLSVIKGSEPQVLTMALPTEDLILDALREVVDPELGLNIVDLGLIYGIEVEPDRIHIRMTMTTPACPLSGLITDNVRETLAALTANEVEIEVDLVWDPPWHPGLMAYVARTLFGA
jgi:metal-sulfur cluster biosynthetic enzyme